MSGNETMLNVELSRKLTFAGLIILIFPSIICSTFILYLIVKKKTIRRRLHNQFFLCIFLVYFLQITCDLPFAIIYFYHGQVPVLSYQFCTYWFILTSVFNMASVHLNAYLSIERYLLIFYSHFLFKYKIILHYLPMIALLLIPIVYVSYGVLFYPCQNQFDYYSWACGSACYLLQPFMGTFTWMFAIVTPLIVMIMSNIILVVRVLYLKQRMIRRNSWNKNKKMVLQLFSLVGILYISWMPSSIASVINNLNSTPPLHELFSKWMLIGFIYLAVLFSPLTITMAIPELKKELRRYLSTWTRRINLRRILPITRTTINPTN
ncbi:hypothetical protein I4U23_003977 [Adineta vaga]|nr:hypothetical protein I4U23_003977 [Adineta vaga]